MLLPEKEHYTLNEIILQWSKLFNEKIDLLKLLDFASQGYFPIYMPTKSYWLFHIVELIEEDKYNKKPQSFKKQYPSLQKNKDGTLILYNERQCGNAGCEFVRLSEETCKQLLSSRKLVSSFGYHVYTAGANVFYQDANINDDDVKRLVIIKSNDGISAHSDQINVRASIADDLYISREDRHKFELQEVKDDKQVPAINKASSGKDAQSASLPEYLNPDHPKFAPELAIAVEIWKHFYIDNQWKSGTRVQTQVESYVDENKDRLRDLIANTNSTQYKLTKELNKRIAKIVSPLRRKSGGIEPV